ncbi:hypothetical protein ENBRE01_0705 [Enteropsectra breve]|nr:hypothetical protein ENBRE01_0705 [Enteropsectra breve]
MEEAIRKNTVKMSVFPSLVHRHEKQQRKNKNEHILYYKQTHEMFMFSYYYNLKLEQASKLSVNGVEGYAMSNISINSMRTSGPASYETFYSALLYAPEPFVFIPSASLHELKSFCPGAFCFADGRKKGILMDLHFAGDVGLDFLASEYLMRSDVCMVYIGIIYDEEL